MGDTLDGVGTWVTHEMEPTCGSRVGHRSWYLPLFILDSQSMTGVTVPTVDSESLPLTERLTVVPHLNWNLEVEV